MPARRPNVAKDGPAVVRLAEATGASAKSWDAAVLAAVKKAKVKSPIGVEVSRLWADLDDGQLSRYRAAVKIAYRQTQRTPGRRTR